MMTHGKAMFSTGTGSARAWLPGRALPWVVLAALCLILGVTYFAYAPVRDADFVNWDDGAYVIGNYRIQQWGWDTMVDYFRMQPQLGPMPNSQYTPLVEVSYAIEHRLAGLDPKVYHTTNLVLHLLTTLLLAWAVRELWGRRGRGAVESWGVGLLSALLFGLHPLHVESVAWVTERKDMLSGLFFVLSMGLYLHGKGRSAWWSAGSVIAMFLGVLSKQVAVTVPACLVLCDWLEEGRFTVRQVLAKWAWWFVAAFGVWAALYSHTLGGGFTGGTPFHLVENVLVAGRGVAQYVWTYVWPFALSTLYTLPEWAEIPKLAFTLCALGTALATVGAWMLRKRAPELFFGWMFFLVALAPSSRLVPVGIRFLSADRFFYVPGIGLLVLTAWGLAKLAACGGGWAWGAAALTAAVCLAWGWATHGRTGVWQNDAALWESMAETAEDSSIPLNGLGWQELLAKHSPSNAVKKAFAALEKDAFDAGALSLLSEVAYQDGNLNKFLKFAGYAEEAAGGDVTQSRPRMSWALTLQGKEDEAAELMESVLEKQPLAACWWTQLGWTKWHGGDEAGAVAALKRAMELDSGMRGMYRELWGADDEAVVEYSEWEKLAMSSVGWFMLQYTAGQDTHLTLDMVEGAQAEEERLTRAMAHLLPRWDEVMNDEEAPMELRILGAEIHRKTAVSEYNLACLQCKAGNFSEASARLTRAMDLDETLRANAREDDDLQVIRSRFFPEEADSEAEDTEEGDAEAALAFPQPCEVAI